MTHKKRKKSAPYESQKTKKKRIQKIIQLFKKYYPQVHCELNYENPLQLLIAVILSAQCTDKRVNQVTPKLFKKYPSAKDYAQADLKELEQDIHTTGFYRSKAKRIQLCCQRLTAEYNSQVPRNMEDLLTLSGVGRKTANVVLGSAFNVASGVVVDTHATRLSHRLNLSKSQSPEDIEQDLNQLIDKKFWIFWSYAIVYHGRYVCKARRPLCEKCFLVDHCPQIGVEP